MWTPSLVILESYLKHKVPVINRSHKKYSIFLKKIQHLPYSLFQIYWNILK